MTDSERETRTPRAPFIHPFPAPPTPFRKCQRTHVATSHKFGPLLLRSFAPTAFLCFFSVKLSFFELLRTLSRGSQKFRPEVRRTCPLGSAEVWLAFSRGRLRGFAISIVGGFFAECFSESRLPLGSRFVAHRSRAHVQCKGQHPPLIIK